ncbi:hypothetical protein JW935_10495 [candidate division KSB1 bacterium]|nr:hypothetical protein [candidate division KSB1 bacterium]
MLNKLEQKKINFKRFIVFSSIFILSTFFQNACFGELGVFDRNPNYLTYKGEPIFLISACQEGKWHISKLDTNFIKSMKNFGANHTWIMLDNYIRTKWSYTKYTPPEYWQKLRDIARVAYEEDVILGISLFSYGIIRYPLSFSYNKECRECDGDPGPLTRGQGFFNLSNLNGDVLEAHQVQENSMKKIVENTWMYPNVYYLYGWELNTVWNDTVAEWVKWARNFMETEGELVAPGKKHLFALEKTLTIAEAETLGVDFIVEEDGNAAKTEGLPYVYWSMDGIYRGTPVWNTSSEPKFNLAYMRSAIFDTAAAGIASIWGTDSVEMDYMHSLGQFAATVENWCDEPGQEITLTTLPPVSGGPGIDLPSSGACVDIDFIPPTIINLFTISESEMQIQFSEPLNPFTATDKNNYQIDPSLIIVSAQLSEDRTIVSLQTATHLRNVIYTLTVNNVSDDAYYPNPIAPGTQVYYSYVTELVVYNVTPAEYDTSSVDVGEQYYIDRDYVVQSMPDSLQGLLWIRTANDDKNSQGDDFVKFSSTTDIRTFVGYDIRIASLPFWLQNWADTGTFIKTSDTHFRMFKKDFNSGFIELGGNYSTAGSMYIVLIKENFTPDTTPPDSPTGLKIEKIY